MTVVLAYPARDMRSNLRNKPANQIIASRIPIRRGAALYCECGGRILIDGYGESHCFNCGWDNWDMRTGEAITPPPTPSPLPSGQNRVRCFTCEHVWIMECDPRDQRVCPSCGTKAWRSQNHKPIRLCNSPGCDFVAAGKGLCTAHYWEDRRAMLKKRREAKREEMGTNAERSDDLVHRR